VRLFHLFAGIYWPGVSVSVTASTSPAPFCFWNVVSRAFSHRKGILGFWKMLKWRSNVNRLDAVYINSVPVFPLISYVLFSILPDQFSKTQRNARRPTDQWYCLVTGTTKLERMVSRTNKRHILKCGDDNENDDDDDDERWWQIVSRSHFWILFF
jgi:hypothetical protein